MNAAPPTTLDLGGWAEAIAARDTGGVVYIAFGSRAAGVHCSASDWDILSVCHDAHARRPRTRIGKLDIVTVCESRVRTADWLGSELAGHVARYGRTIVGRSDFLHHVFRSRRAISRKRTVVVDRLSALGRYSTVWTPPYLRHFARLARRDIQRLACLVAGEPVPPTPILDTWWRASDDARALRLLAERYGDGADYRSGLRAALPDPRG